MKNIKVIVSIIATCLFLLSKPNVNAQLYYLPQYNHNYKNQDDSLFNVANNYYKNRKFENALIALEKISKDYMKSARRDYIGDWKTSCLQQLQDTSVSNIQNNKLYLFEPINPNLLLESDSLYSKALESMSNQEYELSLEYLFKCSESEKSSIGTLHFYRLSTLNDLYNLSKLLNEEKIVLYTLDEIYKIIENELSYMCYLKNIGFFNGGIAINQPEIKKEILYIIDKFIKLFSNMKFTPFLSDYDLIYAKFFEIYSSLKFEGSANNHNDVTKILDKTLEEFKQTKVYNANYVILSIIKTTFYIANNELNSACQLLHDVFDKLLSSNILYSDFNSYYSFTLDRLYNNESRFNFCGSERFTEYVYQFYQLSKEHIANIAYGAPLYDSEYTNLMCSILPELATAQAKELCDFLLENLYLPEDLYCTVIKSQSKAFINNGQYSYSLDIIENALNNPSINFSLDSKISLCKQAIYILKHYVSDHTKYTDNVQMFISLCMNRINEYKERPKTKHDNLYIIELYTNIADIYEGEGNWDETIKIYSEAINTFGNQFSPRYLCNLYDHIICCYLYKRDIDKVQTYIELYEKTANRMDDERQKMMYLNSINNYKANIASLIEIDTEMRYHYNKRMLENNINILQSYSDNIQVQNVIIDMIQHNYSDILFDQMLLGFFNIEEDYNLYLRVLQSVLEENTQDYFEIETKASLNLIDYYINFKNDKVKAKKMLDIIINNGKNFNLEISPYNLLYIAEYYYKCSKTSNAKSIYSTILNNSDESHSVHWLAKLELFKLQYSNINDCNLKEWYLTNLEYLSQKDLMDVYIYIAEMAFSEFKLFAVTKYEALKLIPHLEKIYNIGGRTELVDELYDLYIITENYTKALECYEAILEFGEKDRNKAIYFESEHYRGEQFNDYFDKCIIPPAIIYNSVLQRKNNSLEKSIAFENLIYNKVDTILMQKYNSLQQLTKMIESDNRIVYKGKEISKNQAYMIVQTLEDDIEQRAYYLHNIDKNTQVQLNDIHKNLKAGEAAVEITSFVGFDKNKKLGAAVAINNNVIYIPLCCESEISENETNIESLYKLIWEPILNQIDDCKCIYFSPDGILHKIPLEIILAMYNSDTRVCRVSSTREIALGHEISKNSKAVVFGGLSYNKVDYNDEAVHNLVSIFNESGDEQVVIDSLQTRGGLRYLPGSKEEADQISLLLKENNFKTSYYTEEFGSEIKFRDVSGQNNDIVHVATHGFYINEGENSKFVKTLNNIDDANQSYEDRILNRTGLLFAGANKALNGELLNRMNDGILLGSDISKLDFRFADLIVLSACQTGLGDIKNEGVYGLQRAFKKAGANSILMSLWNVDDKATSILMTRFYENLILGMNKVDALIHAQKYLKNYEDIVEFEIINDLGVTEKKTKIIKPYEEYKFWAPYILLDAIN